MKYGYARVSTIDQKLESQIEQLKNAGAEEIFQEKFTGTTNSRPAFINLLNTLESGDTLIITKLDRLSLIHILLNHLVLDFQIYFL